MHACKKNIVYGKTQASNVRMFTINWIILKMTNFMKFAVLAE